MKVRWVPFVYMSLEVDACAPGTLVASETEEDIFKILNVPWQEPHERVRG